MILKLLALIIPLGLDTFAVSAALGMTKIPPRRRLYISLFFTAFEAGMPLLGLLIGAPLHHLLGNKAEYFAFSLLMLFGLYTVLHEKDKEGSAAQSIVNGWGFGAILLGLSISIDEVAIGLTLGLLNFPIAPVLIVIGIQAFIFSQAGFWLGKNIGEKFRERAESAAGWVLFFLGAILLIEKLHK